jgi:hypothetical protein
MQSHLLNTHTKFEVSIRKTLNATSKKINLDCQIYKIQSGLEMGQNSFSSNSFTD